MTVKEYRERCKANEPVMRSCWNCNPAHRHLKKVDYILWCFECGKLYYKGKELVIEKEK